LTNELPLRMRMTSCVAFVVGLNQKLSVHCVFVGKGGMSWRTADDGDPRPAEITWSELVPVWLKSVLATELLWFPNTIQLSLSGDSKPTFESRFCPACATAPVTRTMSSM